MTVTVKQRVNSLKVKKSSLSNTTRTCKTPEQTMSQESNTVTMWVVKN